MAPVKAGSGVVMQQMECAEKILQAPQAEKFFANWGCVDRTASTLGSCSWIMRMSPSSMLFVSKSVSRVSGVIMRSGTSRTSSNSRMSVLLDRPAMVLTRGR